MKVTLMLTVETRIPAFAPNATEVIDIAPDLAPDEQAAALNTALRQAWADLKHGVSQERDMLRDALTVQD